MGSYECEQDRSAVSEASQGDVLKVIEEIQDDSSGQWKECIEMTRTGDLAHVKNTKKWKAIGRDNGNRLECHLCNREIDTTVKWPDPYSLEIDHLVPVVLGGSDEFTNTAPAHLRCNRLKGRDLVTSRVVKRNPRWNKRS